MAYPKQCFIRISGVFLALSVFFAGCAVKTLPSENKPITSEYLKQIDISIAGVGLGQPNSAADEELIRHFEKNSGVHVIVKKNAALQNRQEYEDYIRLLVNSNGLPDVLIFPEFSPVAEKELLYRLDDLISADRLSEPFRSAASMLGGLYALPFHYALEGYFINSSLFERNNLSAPAFGLSFTKFFSAVKALSEKENVIPISGVYEVPFWYPLTKGAETWGGWKDGSFPLKDKTFLEGISYASQLQKACSPPSADAEAEWQAGKTAFYYGSTADFAENPLPFSCTYIGLPGGSFIVNPSYIGVTKQSAHKQEAFALAKWLSIDQKAIQMRMKLYPSNPYPAIPAAEGSLLKEFFLLHPLEGSNEILDHWEKAVLKGADIIPSYRETVAEKKYLLSYAPNQAHTLEEILRDAVDGVFSYPKLAEELYNQVYPQPQGGQV